ncbi:MAG: D-alanyl-D-alanine carboxypeptidase family protein [Sphaerospermopsis sp. SIO1G2]|nr:D-alanyl-D-alanine carboxypeptidase family protein [Sphaerospermopsis sp. SIO1G2]
MKKSGFPQKPHNSQPGFSDDIPEALRDTNDTGSKLRIHPLGLILGGLIGFIFLAVGSGFLFFITAPKQGVEMETPSENPTPDSDTLTEESSQNNAVLGHLAYPQAPESELVAITADGRIKLRTAAAQKFQAMARNARRAGVILVPISGFRTVQQQERLFFSIGAQRNQTPAERAAVSAPPGHSEHHTGYAVDIGDGKVPATNLQTNFENTQAYQWLEANAARFGFELSFPPNNPQGVSYEPWHWRFVGDRNSLETFYKSRDIKPIQMTGEQ